MTLRKGEMGHIVLKGNKNGEISNVQYELTNIPYPGVPMKDQVLAFVLALFVLGLSLYMVKINRHPQKKTEPTPKIDEKHRVA